MKYKYIFLRFISRFSLLSKIYYFLSGKFDGEIVTTIKGRKKYFENDFHNKNISKLRRDIHRIEKGLVMLPMRKVFALSYLSDVVKQLEKIDSDQMKIKSWSFSVLEKYFQDTESNSPVYIECKIKFYKILSSEKNYIDNMHPQKKQILNKNDLTKFQEKFETIVSCRRSVRHFKKEKIDRKVISASIELSIQAPSACNRVPYRYIVSDDPEMSRLIAECAGGTAGFSKNINNIAILVGDLSNYMYEVDRHAIYIDGSLSAMTFIYSLETFGVSSVCINWHDQKNRVKKLNSIVEIEDYETVIMMIAFGYMDDSAISPYSQKKDIEEVLFYAK